MVSEPPSSSMAHEANVVVEEQVVGSAVPNKKNQVRAPKKIHKAEREKLKRDHLNDLFLELGHALEPSRQSNGKASILGDATRLLRDLIIQVESLRKENATLVTESRYVTVEKNELKDETAALETEIGRLQGELCERMLQTNPVWQNSTANEAPPTLPQPARTALPMPQPPLYVVPLPQDLQAFPEPATVASPVKAPPPQVRRPHARYPTPSDSWPLQVLARHPSAASEARLSGSDSTTKGMGEHIGLGLCT